MKARAGRKKQSAVDDCIVDQWQSAAIFRAAEAVAGTATKGFRGLIFQSTGKMPPQYSQASAQFSSQLEKAVPPSSRQAFQSTGKQQRRRLRWIFQSTGKNKYFGGIIMEQNKTAQKLAAKTFGEVCREWIEYKARTTSEKIWANYEMFYAEYFSPLAAMAMNSMNIKKADTILAAVRKSPFEMRSEFARNNCCSLHMFVKLTLGEIVDYAIRKKYMDNKKELVKFFRVQKDPTRDTYGSRLIYK